MTSKQPRPAGSYARSRNKEAKERLGKKTHHILPKHRRRTAGSAMFLRPVAASRRANLTTFHLVFTSTISSMSGNPSSSTAFALSHALARVAAAAELAESYNWLDDFSAAPSQVREGLGMANRWDEPTSLALVKSDIPFFHFNMGMTFLGTEKTAKEVAQALDVVQDFFEGVSHHVTVAYGFLDDDTEDAVIPEVDKTNLKSLTTELEKRCYEPFLSFDRVILEKASGSVVEDWSNMISADCELVTPETAHDWSDFIAATYHMPPPIAAWLRELVGRPGWRHAILRRDGRVVMARSLYAHQPNGWAWLGIDAPVPGSMKPCYDDDKQVCARLLQAAVEEQLAHSFVSDIEAPNVERSGPDYDKWTALGFAVPYTRQVYKWTAPSSDHEPDTVTDS